MKRSSMPPRSTPMRRSRTAVGSAGRPCPSPARRAPLPATSKKRRQEQRERARMAAETFGTTPPCARCGQPADDLHELLSRARGGSITDPDNCVPLCRPCHDDVTFRHHEIPDADRWVHSRKASA